MASTDDSAPDATSIKPVASLRSRFETLGTDSTPRSFTKSPNLSTASPSRHGARMSLDLRREDTSSAKGLGLGHLQINAHSSHIRHASTSSPKSASMIDLSTTPTVIVDAPVSPVQRSPPRRLSPRSSFVTPSRSSTDQGAIRPNVTLHKPLRSMTGTDAHAAASATAAVATAAAKAKPVPPPINRAGKPGAIATPVLGSSLVQPPGASPAHAPSPFSTPPSSAEGTPIERQADNDFGFASMPTRPAVGHPYNNNGYFAQARREAPHTHTGNRPTVVERAAQTRPSFTTASSTPSIRRINPPDPAQAQHISPNADATILQDIDQRRSSAFSIPSRPTATSQGFDRQPHSLPLSKSPPAAPPSRRSVDLRRDPPPPPRPTSRLKDYETHTSASDAPSQLDASRTLQEPAQAEVVADPSAYPDQSRSNRRPPRNRTGVDQIPTGYETRLCAISGDFVCTSGYVTRIWSVSTGNKLTTIPHDENVRAMSISWKPTKEVIDEHKFLWLGTNDGSLLEVNVTTGMLVNSRQRAHARGAIIRIYSHQSSLYTLDDEAHLYVWSSDDTGSPSLNQTPATHRVTKGHTASIVVDNHLWFVCGKDVQIYRLSAPSDADFQVLQRPLCQESAGIVTSAAILSDRPTELYFGHADGKVSLYDTTNYSCIGVYNVGLYKISTLTGVGSLLWAGYNTGMIYVYDTTVSPWRIVKEWKAHAQPITSIVCDQSSIWETGDLQVVSLGMDNTLQLWDGLLHDDRLSQAMQSHDVEYCTFQDISAAVLTWNVGATTPSTLRSSRADSAYLSEYLASTQSADILMFGFQELVDLEDKKLTAKSFFKSKKRAPTEQEHISSQYRAWRDYLVKSIEECLPKESYRLVHTATMVGLFTCLLVKSHVSSRVKHVSTDEIKRGIGGLHGNKGALLLRLVIDDSSLCFINCHLAAGQSQTAHRHNDVAAILDSDILPFQDSTADSFSGGGDGTMILDHETCILNGDLNYRIDAMTRDAIVRCVRENNLSKLLERDQLLLSRRRNPGFRLRPFTEPIITFAPTYKYNLGTDEYDTSEKKRSPAWCDRIMYKGVSGRVNCAGYRRWDNVRASDHRPVSAKFVIKVKKIDQARQAKVRVKAEKEVMGLKRAVGDNVKARCLVDLHGLTMDEALHFLGLNARAQDHTR